jgi:hypothetical protein
MHLNVYSHIARLVGCCIRTLYFKLQAAYICRIDNSDYQLGLKFRQLVVGLSQNV